MKYTNLATTLLLLTSITTPVCFATPAQKTAQATKTTAQVKLPEGVSKKIVFDEFIRYGLKYAVKSSHQYLDLAKSYEKNNKYALASMNYLLASVEPVSKNSFGIANGYIQKGFNAAQNGSLEDKKALASCLYLIGSNYRTRQRADRDKVLYFYNDYALKAFNELNCANSKYNVLATLVKLRQLNREKNYDGAITLVNNLIFLFDKEKVVYPELLKQVSSTIGSSYSRKQSVEKIAQLKRLLKLCNRKDIECSDLETIPLLETLANRCASYKMTDLADMYSEQILEIASQQTNLEEQDSKALYELKNTLRRIARNRKVKRLKNNMMIEEQKEKVLLMLLDMSKRNGRVSYDSVKSLEELAALYKQQNVANKVLPLYKKAMINVEAQTRDSRRKRTALSVKAKLKKSYLNALPEAGDTTDWTTLESEIIEESKSLTFNDSKSKPKATTKIDYSKNPARHVLNLSRQARNEVKAGKKKNALNSLHRAIRAYAHIPSGARDLSSASKSLWSTISYVQQKSKSTSLDAVIKEVGSLYGMKKTALSRRRVDRTISPVFAYISAKQYKKAEALLNEILKSRTTAFGADDPDLIEILDILSIVYVKTNNLPGYTKAADRALNLAKLKIPTDYSLLQKRLNKMMNQYVAFGKKAKSDALEAEYKSVAAKVEKK